MSPRDDQGLSRGHHPGPGNPPLADGLPHLAHHCPEPAQVPDSGNAGFQLTASVRHALDGGEGLGHVRLRHEVR